MSYAVSLTGFEGPLDLLIHLIQKDKIDICEISISEITHHYLQQIKKWQQMDLEIASEFVVMAARLLEIKAKSLLPGTKTDENEEDLEAKLLQQLAEYKIFKEISEYLREREARELMAIYKDPEYIEKEKVKEKLIIDPDMLADVFRRMVLIEENKKPPASYNMIRELFSIEEKIEMITKALKKAGQAGLNFKDLLATNISREEVVVTLLALLEIVKMQEIKLVQEHVFWDFSIKKEEFVNG